MLETVDLEIPWLAWLAWASIGAMAAIMISLMAIRRPVVAAQARRLFLSAPTTRGRLIVGFGFVALLPILTLPPIIGWNSASRLQDEQGAGLGRLVQSLADVIPGMVARRVDVVNGLAKHISAGADFSDAALEGWLTRTHADNPEFVSMWIARPDGRVPVATAVRNGVAERWSGPINGVGAMDFFQESVAAGGPYVSTVRKDVAPGFHAIIFVSAPIGKAGQEPWGFLQGQLDLSRVFEFLTKQAARAGSEILLTDTTNRVMLSSARVQFRSFESIDTHPLIAAMNTQQDAAYFTFRGTILASGKEEAYVAAMRMLPPGWRVFAVVSQVPAQAAALTPFLVGGLWALFSLLLAYGLAGLYGESVLKPLKQLDESLEKFENEGTISVIPTAPADAPPEVRAVFKKVQSSMRQRRDAYHNMMKALNEGAELKQKLREVSGEELDDRAGNSFIVQEGSPDAPELDETFHGRIDVVTELPGQELFETFFKEAWNFGVANGSPLSLIVVGIGSKNRATLKSVAGVLGTVSGRSLDLVARIEMNEFTLVLPETDLRGAASVAVRARAAVQKVLRKAGLNPVPTVNLGVAAVLPNARGNARAFVEVARRALHASTRSGDGQIAFMSEKGKIQLAARREPSRPAADAAG